MRIAATRSSRLHGLEVSIPKFGVVFEGFQSRSTEVDQICESFWCIFLDVNMDLEAEMLSESRFFTARAVHIGFGS